MSADRTWSRWSSLSASLRWIESASISPETIRRSSADRTGPRDFSLAFTATDTPSRLNDWETADTATPAASRWPASIVSRSF